MDAFGLPWELVLVNDGSGDGSSGLLDEIAADGPRVSVVHFARHYAQTAETKAGMDHARGDIVVLMGGDLQSDPVDIGRPLARLGEGFDVVSAWRRDFQDYAIKRNLPSRLVNSLTSCVSSTQTQDYGCSLKAYRREELDSVKSYGEMHRFVPTYAAWNGAQMAGIPVTYHLHLHGQSKYSFEPIVLFVRLRAGVRPDDALRKRIKKQIRATASPHHVPARTLQVSGPRRAISDVISMLPVRTPMLGKTGKNAYTLANLEALALYRYPRVLAQTVSP